MDLLASNQTIRDEREKARKLRDKVRRPFPLSIKSPNSPLPSLSQFAGLKSASSENQWGGISSGGRYGESTPYRARRENVCNGRTSRAQTVLDPTTLIVAVAVEAAAVHATPTVAVAVAARATRTARTQGAAHVAAPGAAHVAVAVAGTVTAVAGAMPRGASASAATPSSPHMCTQLLGSIFRSRWRRPVSR